MEKENEVTSSGCPVEAPPRGEVPLDVQEERLAQAMLNNPEGSIDSLIGFEEKLLSRYALMMEVNPPKAHRTIGRHLRKVSFAALSTISYTQMLHDVVPRLEQGEPLCPEPNYEPYLVSKQLSGKDEAARPRFEGNAAAYAHCMSEILSCATETAVAPIISDLTHPFHDIWECLEAAQYYWQQSRYPEKSLAAKENYYMLAEDNTIVTLEKFTNLRLARIRASPDTPSPYDLASWGFRSADKLSWAATGKASSIGTLFHTDRLAEKYPQVERARYDDLQDLPPNRRELLTVDKNDLRVYGINHSSLAERPWPHPGFCPAPLYLQMPQPEDQDIARRFAACVQDFRRRYAIPGRIFRPYEQDHSYFDRATMAIQLGTFIAYETIFT